MVNILLRGMRDWRDNYRQAQTLGPCAVVERATEEYKAESNPIVPWLESRTRPAKPGEDQQGETVTDYRSSYENYCDENPDLPRVGPRQLGRLLKEMGFKDCKIRGKRARAGFRLLDFEAVTGTVSEERDPDGPPWPPGTRPKTTERRPAPPAGQHEPGDVPTRPAKAAAMEPNASTSTPTARPPTVSARNGPTSTGPPRPTGPPTTPAEALPPPSAGCIGDQVMSQRGPVKLISRQSLLRDDGDDPDADSDPLPSFTVEDTSGNLFTVDANGVELAPF